MKPPSLTRTSSALLAAIAMSITGAGVQAELPSDSTPAKHQASNHTSLPVIAENQSAMSDWWHGDYGLGEWGGLRTNLRDSGVDIFGSYEANMGSNVSGGRKRGSAYADNFDFGIRFDMEKLVGWHGATITVQGANRDGKSLTDDYVGNFYQVQQLYGVQTVMLYGLHLEQKLWEDKVSIKIGRFSMNEDFANSPIYGLYMGNAIDGNPKALVASNGFSSYPGSVWAARVKIQTTKETELSVGLYQANDRLYNGDNHGLDWTIRDGDGATLVSQFAWRPELFKKPVGGTTTGYSKDGKSFSSLTDTVEMKGLPGNYMIGGYVSFWDVPRFDRVEKSGGLYGIYAHADQMVYQESPGSTQGLTLWSAVVVQPDEKVANVPFQVNAGAIYKGLLPSRDEDRAIVGYSYGKFSKHYARSLNNGGGGLAKNESVIEAGYRVQITKFAYIMPEVQYIIDPSGTGAMKNALVLGLRTGFTF